MTKNLANLNVRSLSAFCIFVWALGCSTPAHAATTQETVATLRKEWAIIKYQEPDKEQQAKDITKLVDKAAQISLNNPGKAEPLIWQAIIISTKADIEGGIGALHDVEHSRDLLLQAEQINPSALHGVIYTSLGVLYYKVPGWPVGFGDKKLAKEYLEKGLALNPDSIDSNFFYGDFLFEAGDYAKAKSVLEHGYAAPIDSKNDIAAVGRHEEIRLLLARVSVKTF